MNIWVVLGLVLTSIVGTGALASIFELLPAGQVVATLSSVTVATVGLFVFFKKSKN